MRSQTSLRAAAAAVASAVILLTLAAGRLAAQTTPAAPAPAAPGPVGWTLTMNMSIDSGNGAAPVTMSITQMLADRRMRTEYGESSIGNGMLKGMSMIVNLGDSTVTNVVPGQQMAMVMPYSLMAMGRSFFSKPPVYSLDSVEDLGAGPSIAGHATRHVRRTVRGALQIDLGDGKTCQRPIDMVSEEWIAPDVQLDSAMAGMRDMLGGGMPDLSELVGKERGKLPPGSALKTISTSHDVGSAGHPITVTMTSELTTITHGPIDAAAFSVPLGYQTMDMASMAAMSGQDLTASVKQAAAAAAARMCAKPAP